MYSLSAPIKAIASPVLDYYLQKQIEYTDELHLKLKETKFDTSSDIAKQWFFPRYLDGSLHEPVVTRAIIDRVSQNTVFFDIGANVGYYTLLLSKFLPDGALHAFEMDHQLISIIEDHLHLNQDIESDVRLVCASVSRDSEKVYEFEPHQTGNKSTNRITNNGSPKNSNLSSVSISIDDYISCTGVNPDIIKTDVEGHELSALKGAEHSLGSIDTIFIEVHPDLLMERGTDADQVIHELRSYGYDINVFDDHRADTTFEDSTKPLGLNEELETTTMLLCKGN